MKKQLPKIILCLLALAALVWYVQPRTLDELAKLSEDVKITATYWYASNSYEGATWEAGSPESQKAMALLRETNYSRSPFRTVLNRLNRLNQAANGNTGMMTLVLDDGQHDKFLIGFFATGEMSFYGSRGFFPENTTLKSVLVAMATA